jgi:adenylate kinase family enzyme
MIMNFANRVDCSPIGRRIHVMGNTSAGKSTLGARLARALDVPFVELDALNWQPGWVGLNTTNPQEFERRIRAATAGEGWVVAGSYSTFSQRIFWPQLQTVVWLDLPLPQLLWRVLTRSWRRWRAKELLWGTNYERFWPQLMVWRKADSLVWWAVTQQRRKRRSLLGYMTDPRWAHIHFVRLTSSAEIELFSQAVESVLGYPRWDEG